MTKLSCMLTIVTILLGYMGSSFLTRVKGEVKIAIRGVVCNYSSIDIWLTVTESRKLKPYTLHPGYCTDVRRQDVEAIWGRTCNTDACEYQAWKLGIGRYRVFDDGDTLLGSILRIKGWGAGSGWHITGGWPKPDLLTINYSLVK